MKKSAHIFISYRHQEPDSSLAHGCADTLKRANHNVFIDTGIHWGSDWVREIQQALEKADFLLLLLSREAAKSNMVMEEVKIALDLAKQKKGFPVILPIRVHYPFSEPLPYHISGHLRTIQQVCWAGDDDTPRLLDLLLQTVEDQTNWPEEETEKAKPGGIRSREPQPHFDPRNLIEPGGAIDTDDDDEDGSSIYVRRKCDDDVLNAVHKKRAMITVRGPRQTGKTSLIMSVYAAVRKEESRLRTAFIDFQALLSEDFQTLDTIWHTIAIHIAEQIQLEEWDPVDNWQSSGRYDRNFSLFLDRFVFHDNDQPLLICLDEVDRAFKSPVKNDFFPTVRAFYNRGAMDPSWKKVRWLLATSTEPKFFIKDLSQSPFNIGKRVDLNSFTPQEVEEFARRHGLTDGQYDLDQIMDYVGGRPYLVHLLFYHMVQNPDSRNQLFDAHLAGGGVFREHLHRYLMKFQRDEELAEGMRNIIAGKDYKEIDKIYRLESAGLVRRDENQKVVPFCRLYKDFFQSELK